jgi:hypothetical protein
MASCVIESTEGKSLRLTEEGEREEEEEEEEEEEKLCFVRVGSHEVIFFAL